MLAEGPPSRYGAFGLDITTSIALPGTWSHTAAGCPAVSIELADAASIAAAWSGDGRPGWSGVVDGHAFVVEHGAAGDLRLRLGDGFAWHLTVGGAVLMSPDGALGSVIAMRSLLDSVLFSVSLVRGNEALHAGAVAKDGGVIAICGPSGAGKSSLAGGLLELGCSFVTDDVLVVGDRGDALLAYPGPPLMTVAKPLSGFGAAQSHLADLEGEVWLGVQGAARELPLVGLIELGAGEQGTPVAWTDVLGHFLRFPLGTDREARRLHMTGRVIDAVPRLRLKAHSAHPEQLAQMALDWLRDAHPHWGPR